MKKNFCYIVFFIVLIADTSAQTGLNGVIKGIIKDKDGALEAATISAGKKAVLSNHAGKYSISISPGIYTLTISFSGYQTIIQEVAMKTCEIIELDFTLTPEEKMEDAVVLGSRSAIRRSNMNTPVPVDVISAKQLSIGQSDLTQNLFITVPSFNAPPQTIGFGALISPATLRGLGTDQTLVLINGHRRHTTAYPFLLGGLGYGSVATDFNAIPVAAIENIEILRDGAAAQYGSDAIAGVLNLQLKKTIDKTSVYLTTGEFSKGDGKFFSFDINKGLVIGKKGFLNFTTDLRFRDYTQRNGEYDGTVYRNIPPGASQHVADSLRAEDNQIIVERGFSRLNHRPIGNPKILNAGFVINGGYSANNKINLFWTGTMNFRFGDLRSSATYRFPKDSMTSVITELYPDGFLPNVANRYWDYSGIIGAENINSNGWHWDLSSIFGGNSQYLYVNNTNNASQYADGKNAQTEFYSGNIFFNQNTNNLNFSRDFAKYLRRIKSFTISFGSEFRIEHFVIKPGEEASWNNYSPISGRMAGAQGLAGFMPVDATNKNRYIMAGYGELEMDVNNKLLWNLAGRYEHYNDFGGNVAGKLAMRYKFSNRFMLRAGINNGFRAPSIQQRYFSSVSQVVRFGQIFITGTFPNDNNVATAFGIVPLQAEKSLNVSGGLTAKISAHIDLTLDAYWIQIKDRIILTGIISKTIYPRVNQILDSIHRTDINSVRFFTNAINTRTHGADLVLTGRWPFRKSVLEISLSGNCNKTIIYKVTQPAKSLPDDSTYRSLMINREEIGRIEHGQIGDKIIFSAGYKTKKWEFRIRSEHYGKVAHFFPDPTKNPDEFYSGKILTGFISSFSLKPSIIISTGVGNMFNVHPDQIKNYANTQNGYFIYDNNVNQIGFNGRYYFVRFEFNWDAKKKPKAF